MKMIPILTWLFFVPITMLIFSSGSTFWVSGICQSDDQSLLVQFHNSLTFNQSKSTKLVRWNFSSDCCDWAGVTCDDTGHVVGLYLANETISGGLGHSNPLFSFHHLLELDLSFNNFNTSMPAMLANLSSLISLNLSKAGFSGQIPLEISYMTNLVKLDLSMFTVDRPLRLENPDLSALVQNLTRLEQLYLDGVNISTNKNVWCQALSSSLHNLQVLSLIDCSLSAPIHPSLLKLKYLSTIRLGGNNFSTHVPDFFTNFSDLRILELFACEFHGAFPESIFQIAKLESLDLSYNQDLQGFLPDKFQNSSLKTLVVCYTKFSGRLPKSIGALANLSVMDLNDCDFTGQIPSSMANLSQLVYLDFSRNMFSGAIPSFAISKKLIYVDLSGNNLSGEISNFYQGGFLNLVYVDFSSNSLSGSIPSSLFAIPSLQKLVLSSNKFGGGFPYVSDPSVSSMIFLDLSSNQLEGSVPSSVFDLRRLSALLLSFNKLNGIIKLDWIQKLTNLNTLDLSYNDLIVDVSASNSTFSSFPPLSTLLLASCNLRMFPDLRNQSYLYNLDLSDNQITGLVPSWIWKIGVYNLNLSYNLLVGLQQPYSIPILTVLDLQHNQFTGRLPAFPQYFSYLDYSSNKFTTILPDDVTNLNVSIFISLANNSLTGVLPKTICAASYLQVLDLSGNKFNGTIPRCLIKLSDRLGILNLRRNNFNGNIPDHFPRNCSLQTLDLSGNLLEGKVPKSLANCVTLEVLNLGRNKVNDTFPCLLMKIPDLRVLVLRKNAFHGNIRCALTNVALTKLQILDLASNNFSGELPNNFLSTWYSMMGSDYETEHIIKFVFLPLGQKYYQDSVTVSSKGLEWELVKILTIFTSFDVSKNNFEGPIPEVVGKFKALHVLNLSHNRFSHQIPSSIGNLSQLESLDLSFNSLSGMIPQQLSGLTFLSVLNLSYNQLVGMIPTGNQLETFEKWSYEGNQKLCGYPLKSCDQDHGVSIPQLPSSEDIKPQPKFKITRNILIGSEAGFLTGLTIVIAPLIYCRRWRKWYYDHVDRALFKIFPRLDQATRSGRRRHRRNPRQRG